MLTAGELISEHLNIKLENVTVQMLGRAKRVTITKDDTTIIHGAGKKTDIEARISQTEAMVAEMPKKNSGAPAMPGGGMGMGGDY